VATSISTANTSPFGPPLLGALLRMPVDVLRDRMLDALHERGFTDLIPAHLVILRYPGPDGRRPVEIAAQSGMSKQALNYLLGQLEALGYLGRSEDPHDRRSRRVHLTPRGRSAIATIRTAVTEVEQEWARHLGTDDLEQLRALLTRLAAVVADPGSSSARDDA
jgi:DNA-binding MarR family transcriptional regulator